MTSRTLPPEILRLILSCLTAPELASTHRVCRGWRRIGSERLLWRSLCKQDFIFWSDSHEIQRLLQARADTVDWQAVYQRRRSLERQVDSQLELIINQPANRVARIESLAQLGYDAKDALLRHTGVKLDQPDCLARRSWMPPEIAMALKTHRRY